MIEGPTGHDDSYANARTNAGGGKSDVPQRVYQWWLELAEDPRGRRKKRGMDRAAMAELRRCHTPTDALFVPATLSLLQRLPSDLRESTRALALVAVLGHVREHDPERIARRIGRTSLDAADSAKLSEARFRRLLQSEGDEELQRAMTRLVRFMGQRADVRDLARSILYWGDKTRRRWVFDYYAVRFASPDTGPADAKTDRSETATHSA